ncbi:hypothetical protein Hanom_Chr17g01532811 [Helianthus anomalus]
MCHQSSHCYVFEITYILMNFSPLELDSARQTWRSSSLEIGRRLPSVSSYSTHNSCCFFNSGNLFITSLHRSVNLAERGSVNLIK